MKITTTLGLTILAGLLCQANASFAAVPDMQAHKLATAPLIDGVVIGDAAWTGAIPATGFRQVQPNDGQPASQKTEVFIRLSYSFTPNVQLQALVQYNDNADTIGTNIRFSWLRNANSGLYLVYNEIDERFDGAPATGREFILKYSHIFDLMN